MNESTEVKARYTICSITTTDRQLALDAKELNNKGITHEFIYRTGVETLKSQNNTK